MIRVNATLARGWTALGPRFLPFADAATVELPIGRLMRLRPMPMPICKPC